VVIFYEASEHMWLQSLCIDSNSKLSYADFHDLVDDFVLCVVWLDC